MKNWNNKNKIEATQKLKLMRKLTVFQKIWKQSSIQKTYKELRRRPTGKSRITEHYNIYRKKHENFSNLWKTIEKSLKYQSDLNGNIINLTKRSFTKTVYKLLNKNLSFTTTPKVCNKNKLEKDLNDFFSRIIVIRNGKIVWKHGPTRPFFLYNLSSENY